MSSTIIKFLVFALLVHSVYSVSCRYGRAACVGSCMAQNCATGYCPNGPDGICVCSRCDIGPMIPRR